MIYFVVFVLLLVPVIKYDLLAKSGGENKWYAFIFVLLVLFAGLRYRVGSDTLMYMSMFDDCPKLDELKYFDFENAKYNPFWYIINAVSKSIYDNFTLFQIIHALIVNSVFFWFFRKYCPKYYFSAVLLYYFGYFCYFNMEVMRESLSISVLLLATPFYMKRRWIPYLCFSVAGVMIHYSAALMFLLPFLLFFRRPSWKWEILLMAVVLVMMKVVNLPMLLLNLFGVNEQLIYLIEGYIYEERNAMGILSEFVNFMPALGFIWFRERHDVDEEYDFTPIIMGTVVFYALAMSIGIFSRFINYFVPYLIIYAVNTIYHVPNLKFRHYQISSLACTFAFVILCFNMMRFYTRDTSDSYPGTRAYVRYIPYHSVLDPEIDERRERFVENDREVSIQF